MKKRILMLMLVLSLGGTACGAGTEPDTGVTSQEQVEKPNVDLKEENKENISENKEIKVNLFVPNEMADGVNVEEVVLEDGITEDALWKLLTEKGVITEDCKINKFEKKENELLLDVNEGFGTYLRSFGTSGEQMVLQCVVNTFLENYHCEFIKITEENGVLCSGHAEYAEPFGKFE